MSMINWRVAGWLAGDEMYDGAHDLPCCVRWKNNLQPIAPRTLSVRANVIFGVPLDEALWQKLCAGIDREAMCSGGLTDKPAPTRHARRTCWKLDLEL